jgi:hypothetical protein
MLLLYSVDTVFTIQGAPLGPLSAITLGLLPNRKAQVASTTSGLLVDVRTGYIYGVAEATERDEQRTNPWDTGNAIDKARLDSEHTSFSSFVGEFETLWQRTVEQYRTQPVVPAPVPDVPAIPADDHTRPAQILPSPGSYTF